MYEYLLQLHINASRKEKTAENFYCNKTNIIIIFGFLRGLIKGLWQFKEPRKSIKLKK